MYKCEFRFLGNWEKWMDLIGDIHKGNYMRLKIFNLSSRINE